MSPRTAVNAIGAGFAVAATAALAQLGLAYGFGLLSWANAAPGAADSVLDYRWNANLAWVAWFSAASCVVGGIASGAVGARDGIAGSPAWRVAGVLASAVGAFAVGPLVALSAEQGATFADFPTGPVLAAGGGAVVGLLLALISLASRSVAANVGASVALVWLLAILATFVKVGEPATPVTELAVWGTWGSSDTALGSSGFSITIPFVVGSAIIGVVVAVLARRGPITNSGYRIAAASGIAGPLIVTAAHLAGGLSRADDPESMAVLLVGPYAAIAGLLGSLIVSAIPRSGGQIDDRSEPAATTERHDSLVESAPGWTVPEPPSTVYGSAASADDAETTEPAPAKPKRSKRFGRNKSERTKGGDTKEMPGGPDNEASDDPDPDVDWVQELKPVGQTDTITAEPEAKPKRATKKAAKRTRRKLSDSEPDADSED